MVKVMDNIQEQEFETAQQKKEDTTASLSEGNQRESLEPIEVMLLWVSNARHLNVKSYEKQKEELITTFQEEHGLQITKQIDEATEKEIENVFGSAMGDPDAYPMSIRALKTSLNHLGFSGIKLSNQLGHFTIKRMKEFQHFYHLSITDDITIETLCKIVEIESSSLQVGNRHPDLIQLKEMLNMLGFGHITITDKFGKRTKEKVQAFQKVYNYPVNGMLDTHTANKIRSVFFATVNIPGGKHKCVRSLKQKLNRLGFGKILLTNKLGPYTVEKLGEFQSYYDLPNTGKVDEPTFEKMMGLLMSPLRLGKSDDMVPALKKDLSELGYGTFTMTRKFDAVLERQVKQFQQTYQLPVNGIVDRLTFDTIDESVRYKERVINRNYHFSLEDMLDKFMSIHPMNVENEGTANEIRREATRDEVEAHVNPINQMTTKKEQFQFLSLALPEVTHASYLDKILEDKGAFKGMGQSFVDAGIEYGINEIFLVSHALEATENGRSPLATGMAVDENGKIIDGEGVTEQTTDSSINQEVFNVYGLSDGSDESSLEAYAKKAKDERWNSISRSIIEGAHLMKEKHITDGSDTFYKIQWQPENMAIYHKVKKKTDSDIAWASKQAEHLYKIYQQLDGYTLYLDIPNYAEKVV